MFFGIAVVVISILCIIKYTMDRNKIKDKDLDPL